MQPDFRDKQGKTYSISCVIITRIYITVKTLKIIKIMNPVIDRLFVDNLKCEGCAKTIKNTLMEMAGVISVYSNPEEGWVEVEHEDFAEVESISDKLAELGYPKAGTTTFSQTAESYFSCAIGRLGI
jgi:copper chaperone CopZ